MRPRRPSGWGARCPPRCRRCTSGRAGARSRRSRTVRVVDRLEERGLATRARDPRDGRGVLVHLTPAGRRAGRRVLDARAAALEQALPEAERAELAEIAERLLARA